MYRFFRREGKIGINRRIHAKVFFLDRISRYLILKGVSPDHYLLYVEFKAVIVNC
jgi:hypothetical protein